MTPSKNEKKNDEEAKHLYQQIVYQSQIKNAPPDLNENEGCFELQSEHSFQGEKWFSKTSTT